MYSHNIFKLELEEFCNNYLAYITDDYQLCLRDRNRDVNVYEIPIDRKIHQELDDLKFVEISIKRNNKFFYWHEIKDHIIPFLKLFSRRYKTGHITLKEKQILGCIYRQYKISDVIEDKLNNKKIVEVLIDLY